MRTSEHWQQVEELFHAALNLEPGRRAVFLSEACATEPELLAEIESLISAHEAEGSFIDSPAYEGTAVLTDSTQAESRIGKSVGHYALVASLGKGAMGQVYLADDSSLRRKVAIKFLTAETVSDEQARKRLIREAQATATLDHPNICTIHEVGTESGECFIVMQYVEGETLASYIRRKPLQVREALAIAAQVADALSEAHTRGIIHRDIKPSNIMITARGQVKLMDFGIAKVIKQRSLVATDAETATLLTAPGMILGTVPYMSPEQVRGEELDGRSDIFSFGAVLYEMLSGHQPFTADSPAATLSAILSREPPPLRARSDVPAKLQRIVRKCLEKERERRYQSARDLWVDLSDLERDTGLGMGAVEKVVQRARTRAYRHRLTLTAALVAVLALGSSAVYQTCHTAPGPITSIAVLPFVNASGDPDAEYFSDGITESIINNLSQLSTLRVMARTTVFRYKGRDSDPRAVGRDLVVDAVLTGKAAQRGDTLTIQADLVRVSDGTELWGEHYNRKLSDVFAVQEEIPRQISERLKVKLSGEEERRLARRDTENTEAYQLYLKGRYYVYKYTEFIKAIDYFNQAIAIDSNYALPHAGLAEAYFHAADVLFPPAEAMPKVGEEAQNALKIDPLLAEAHVSMGRYKAYYDWNWAEAEKEFKRAIELNPRLPTAYHEYAVFLSWRGRPDEADAQMKRGLELDPVSIMINTDAGLMFYWRRQYDRAIDQFRKTIDLDPTFWGEHLYLGMAYDKTGAYADAQAEFQKAKTLSEGSAVTLAAFGHLYAVLGKNSNALEVLRDLEALSRRSYVSSYYLAIIYAGLGQNDHAFEALDKTYMEHSDYLVYLNVEPLLDGLRSDPRFSTLLRRVRLTS